MATLETTVDGIKMPNPFVIGSGPPGTNVRVIKRAFKEGWGGVIAKTVSLDASKVVNVGPRYAKLHSTDGKEVIGWENIELISDRPFEKWLDEFKECKDEYPDGVLIASIMEEFNKDAWCEITERCQEVGVDAFELNFSCPHGLPERKMGAAMGQDPDILGEVCSWVNAVSKIPVWAKMTPNVTHIEEPSRAALANGCEGIAAINTIRSVMGVDLETLRPMPTVEGYTTPGGYSSRAVKPIALRMVMEIAQLIRKEFPGRSLSAIGGVETGRDAAEFILLGGDTVQVCTGVMKFGYGHVKTMCDQLLEFMDSKGFETLDDFRGQALDYFTTHAELVRMQTERKSAEKAAKEAMVASDGEWDGDDFVKQSDQLAGN
ncbi:NAD-dependent dihydropyrimidine dehydrogenase subunit PreA [Roseibacillus persicicus]|uniref:NAD-dependent dihydropyrimidine dehydrogenase subunit PreA n=1 Tax=Roseibacillus persicicus TaxID=454148 RepID=UPI00280F178E|nr:NAD-dependent dihydropyrimidine dehydrogenase subunit PreA [Roseibacillus persicicus]MDQ8189742.1 NAD-dependent dihydropyrimidine dehydrogenase subunit PreA [Roseibacillus persicicus]